jgi:hypothetical protein
MITSTGRVCTQRLMTRRRPNSIKESSLVNYIVRGGAIIGKRVPIVNPFHSARKKPVLRDESLYATSAFMRCLREIRPWFEYPGLRRGDWPSQDCPLMRCGRSAMRSGRVLCNCWRRSPWARTRFQHSYSSKLNIHTIAHAAGRRIRPWIEILKGV